MPSPESRRIRATLVNDRTALDVPIDVQRQEWEASAALAELPPQIAISPLAVTGLAGEWLSAPNCAHDAALLFLHGGGYSAGSCVTHRELAARICLAGGVRALLLNYRLAPEHPFPAAVEDATAGYRWLLKSGVAPARIVVAGDSSGGGLALATLLRAREQGLAMPAGAALISPWTDLALTGPSLQSRADADPLCSREGLQQAAALYLAGADATAPLASPLYADLRGLPPLLIHVGGDEALLSDATRLAERAQAAGVEVALEVWEEMWHVWHAWAGMPEAQQAVGRVGAFIRRRISAHLAAA